MANCRRRCSVLVFVLVTVNVNITAEAEASLYHGGYRIATDDQCPSCYWLTGVSRDRLTDVIDPSQRDVILQSSLSQSLCLLADSI